MTTLGKISEQIKRLMAANPSSSFPITGTEIKLCVTQVLNNILKTERLKIRLPDDDFYPDAVMISEYDNIPVVKCGTNRSSSELPVYPLSLPKNIGVWEIADMNKPDVPFIPLNTGVWSIIRSLNPINTLAGQVGFEVSGRNIIYTTNILMNVPVPITKVRMKLLIVDINNLNEYQTLPIPPDMEQEVILQTFNILSLQPNRLTVDNRANVNLNQMAK